LIACLRAIKSKSATKPTAVLSALKEESYICVLL